MDGNDILGVVALLIIAAVGYFIILKFIKDKPFG